ncbi:RDD family protein [Nocardioides sp. GY 10127]|nr:RDD family protein [Nocardioides sp. GY 10127]
MLALAVDWVACLLVTSLFVPVYGADAPPSSGFVVLGVFVVESAVFVALARGSFGQLVVGLRVVKVDAVGAPIGLLQALARQIMVAVVVPPLIFKPDGRGLHDMAVGSVTVERSVLQGRARS